MRNQALILATSAALALSACTGYMTPQEEKIVAGGLIGAGAGLVTAAIFGANSGWTTVAVLTGAAIGTMVARNNQTGECAYAVGGGRYRIAPCG